MKLFAIIASFASAQTISKCFECYGATVADCVASGVEVDCQANQGSCQLEERRRGGAIESVSMRCKQKRACKNNMKQNSYGQCTTALTDANGAELSSVCRQCFPTADPNDGKDWLESLEAAARPVSDWTTDMF
ncbi:Oidioi.mRNA.OKI2018_I69.PAR.g12236.t1.cds [Oikopleura dioica]|uniref:Oidioi.mRNA.OKI2018_I69.PAR.g12236.t1.cds n=1 Tax=Oikopleura dioica TaxID=34765 RepID=A0ABN7RZ84_OIKDI|nr:Oidioi.mRNA.OKI2018_I69.PAR.g12236.t1.cds [Oikopleura dioica]